MPCAAALRPGESVLVPGGGPIGLAAATCARQLGAAEVVVADRLPARRALARAFGATAVIDATDDAALATVSDVCGGLPDVVVECVGSPGMLHECLQHVRRRGRVIVVSPAPATSTANTSIRPVGYSGFELSAVSTNNVRRSGHRRVVCGNARRRDNDVACFGRSATRVGTASI